MTSPDHSALTGESAAEGNTSRMPPRSENCPCVSTCASREYPRSTRRPATVMGSGPRPGASSTAPSTRSCREMVCRVYARRDATTTAGSSAERASASSASSRLLTDSSKAGGRSRNETVISANAYVDGRPLSHSRSSSANRSGAAASTSTGLPRSRAARASEPATMGHADRGSLPTCSRPPSRSQRSSFGSAAMMVCQSVTPTPRSPMRPAG